MNPAFQDFLSATADDRRDAFLGTSRRLGTPAPNIEKDFWVCWTLDALFNGADAGGPRLLFKGGTSLSKAFGLISRFSEDIDITIFRDDLGQGAGVDELEALSGKKRRARLDAIKAASQAHIGEGMRSQLARQLEAAMLAAGMPPASARLELDPDDPDQQSLLIWYPQVTAAADSYVRPAVKIEAGAKSALVATPCNSCRPPPADTLRSAPPACGSGGACIDPQRSAPLASGPRGACIDTCCSSPGELIHQVVHGRGYNPISNSFVAEPLSFPGLRSADRVRLSPHAIRQPLALGSVGLGRQH